MNYARQIKHPLWQKKRCLCHKCHKDAHAMDDKLRQALANIHPDYKERVLGYISALSEEQLTSGEDTMFTAGYIDALRGDTGLLREILTANGGQR